MFQKSHRTFRRTLLLYTAWMSFYIAPAASQVLAIQSTFETDSEGWSVADWNNPELTTIIATYSVTWNASGGNPGGYISSTDPSGNWFWLAAPTKFLGNQAAAYGNSLQFDLFSQSSDGQPDVLVILTGAGQRLYFQGDAPATTFTSYTVPLTPSGWRLNDYQTGVEPTVAEMQTVLGSLDGLYIDGDWRNGNEVTGLDNVRLNRSPTPDHFLCYKAKPTPDSPKSVLRVVSLADQFDTAARDFDVKRPLSLCTPTDKNGEGITDPDTHLKGYLIRLTKTEPPQPPDVKHAVEVTNQFGELLLDTLRPDRLLVPTAKNLTGPTDPPGPNNVDHYKCYKVRGSKGAPKFKPILGVSVSDQFINQPPKLFDIKKPTRLCNPVEKNGEEIKNPDTHLLCYQAKPTRGQPRHQPISPIFVNNQFGPEILQTVKEEDLCVPSTKAVLGVLGPVSDTEDFDDEGNPEE